MADFLSYKLLDFHSINPGASLPFHVSPHLSLFTVCLSPPKRRSSSPISCNLSSHPNSSSSSLPPPIEIVSTTECLDGSLLFRFGDPSEIVAIDEDVSDTSVSDSDLREGEGLDEEVVEAGSISEAVNRESVVISSDDVVLEPNAVGIQTVNVAELEVLHKDAIERDDFESVSVGVEEKGTSAADFHEEGHANQVNDSITSSELGVVVEIETNSLLQEEAPGEINDDDDSMYPKVSNELVLSNKGCDSDESIKVDEHGLNVETNILLHEEAPGQINDDDDSMYPKVSNELDLPNKGCDSDESIKVDEHGSNVDSLDSLVHIADTVTDDCEEMPKHERLEADLAIEEELGDEFPSDLLGEESFVDSVVVDDGSCHTMFPDESVDSDVASNEISDSGIEIEQTDDVAKGEEISSPILALASGVTSLTCPSQVHAKIDSKMQHSCSSLLSGVEDAYYIAGEKWFIVASSVGQWSLEGMKPGLYAHELVQNFQSLTLNSDSCKENVKGVLKQSAATVQSPGLATVLVAHFDNEVLHVANIGDTGFIVIRNGAVHISSSPINHEFNLPVQIGSSDDPLLVAEEHQVHIHDGDVIIMATDALFDNLYEKDIASIVSKSLQDNKKPKEIAELLATTAQELGKSMSARCPFADEAQAAGYTGFTGGKLDHATVIVSLVKKQLSPQD